MAHPATSMVEALLAWRNVWKNKRRTVLTLLTIVVGLTVIIFSKAIHRGTNEQMINDAISADTGDIQIHEKGFWENRSIEYAFIPTDKIIRALESDGSIYAFSMRVQASGLVSSGDTTEGAVIEGVDPAAEARVTDIHRCILRGGRYLVPGDRISIIMGETMAHNMGVKVGDTVSMLSQGFDGSIAAGTFTIVGLFRSGNPEYDRSRVFMPLSRAMQTFTMMGYVNTIVIRLEDPTQMGRVRDSLMKAFGGRGSDLEIMGWDRLMPEIVQFISWQDVTHEVLYFILFIIVAFGVLNTIQLSVYERTREFGIMLAIGTRPAQIFYMVLAESFFISIAGIVLGVLAGSAISYYFTLHPLDYTRFQKEIEVWGINRTLLPARLELVDLAYTSIYMFALSLIFTLLPAFRAARLNPVKAIQKL